MDVQESEPEGKGRGHRVPRPPDPDTIPEAPDPTSEEGIGRADFRELYVRYRAAVIWYIHRRLGGALAEDTAHDVWEVAWRDRERFDPERFEAWPWIVGIARHVVHHRRSADRRRATAEAEVTERVEHADEVNLEVTAEVAALLAHLSVPARQILLMRFVLGYRRSDIADALGMSEAAVAKHITRALKFLREGDWRETDTSAGPPPA